MIFGASARQIEAELQEAHSRINALVKANYTLEVRVLELETNLKTALAKIAAQEAQERELASINHKKTQAILSARDSTPKTQKTTKARKEKATPKRSRGFMINRRNKKDTQ